jgi:hypothetical protein
MSFGAQAASRAPNQRVKESANFDCYKRLNIPATDLYFLTINKHYPKWADDTDKFNIDAAYERVRGELGEDNYGIRAKNRFADILHERTKKRAMEQALRELIDLEEERGAKNKANYAAHLAARAANAARAENAARAARAENAAQASKKRKIINAEFKRQYDLKVAEQQRQEEIERPQREQKIREQRQHNEMVRDQMQQQMIERAKQATTITLRAIGYEHDGIIEFNHPYGGDAIKIKVENIDIGHKMNIPGVGNVTISIIKTEADVFNPEIKRIQLIVVNRSSSEGGRTKRRRTKRSKRSKRVTRRR